MSRILKKYLGIDRLSNSVANLERASEGAVQNRQDFSSLRAQNEILARDVESLKLLCGRIAARQSRALPAHSAFAEAEFQVFSQWGEDGIIQFLLAHVPISNEVFVEFGVQSYLESNTRFLLMNNLWAGLIMDGSEDWMAAVRASDLAWRHTLHAKAAWVTAENINGLISSAGISGDIGILSVDIDGMDYWVWKAVNVVQPRIVIAEYNSLFGPDVKVTPPYKPDFERTKAHHSNLFYGISLAGLAQLGSEKGYTLVGTNSAGNNAFLVRDDLAPVFPKRSISESYRAARFREARGADGQLVFPTFVEAQAMIADCTVHDLSTGTERPLKDVKGWRSAA
jgi:hypothetical protein